MQLYVNVKVNKQVPAHVHHLHHLRSRPRTGHHHPRHPLLRGARHALPERRGQERIYSPRDKVSLKLILRGKRIGFSLAECRELIELYDPDPSSGNQKQLNTMLEKIAERRAQLEQQLLDIEQMQLELILPRSAVELR